MLVIGCRLEAPKRKPPARFAGVGLIVGHPCLPFAVPGASDPVAMHVTDIFVSPSFVRGKSGKGKTNSKRELDERMKDAARRREVLT